MLIDPASHHDMGGVANRPRRMISEGMSLVILEPAREKLKSCF